MGAAAGGNGTYDAPLPASDLVGLRHAKIAGFN